MGGSIAGSTAARFVAESGLKTLLVESAKTPREKPCSGIQFKYFEKLIGKKIPKEKLCTNQLNKLYMEFPDGNSFNVNFSMLNFNRDVFDSWLNSVAIEAGSEFRDEVRCTDFKTTNDGFTISLRLKHGDIEEIKSKYLVAADGLSSSIRKKVRPQDFHRKEEKPQGVTLNYYLKCNTDGKLNLQTLYQFWNLDFSNLMFAWTYKKNDLWVVGTGHSENVKEHCDFLLEYVKKKFDLKGDIVKTEGFASKFSPEEPNRVYLGEGNLLFVGDAAGLVDMHRGLGMDAAALSGRHAASAILLAEKEGVPAMDFYEQRMRNIVNRIDKNSKKQFVTLKTNEELLEHLKSGLMKTGMATFFANLINKILPANKIILLPI